MIILLIKIYLILGFFIGFAWMFVPSTCVGGVLKKSVFGALLFVGWLPIIVSTIIVSYLDNRKD